MDCIFCKIVSGDIPCNIVYEDDHILAFSDLSPQAPEHVLVIPKKHIESLAKAEKEDLELLGLMQLKIAEIAKMLNIQEKGYRLISNVGKEGGQTVSHLHYHLLGGRMMQWPPG